MKKILVLALSLLMVLTMLVPSFATEGAENPASDTTKVEEEKATTAETSSENQTKEETPEDASSEKKSPKEAEPQENMKLEDTVTEPIKQIKKVPSKGSSDSEPNGSSSEVTIHPFFSSNGYSPYYNPSDFGYDTNEHFGIKNSDGKWITFNDTTYEGVSSSPQYPFVIKKGTEDFVLKGLPDGEYTIVFENLDEDNTYQSRSSNSNAQIYKYKVSTSGKLTVPDDAVYDIQVTQLENFDQNFFYYDTTGKIPSFDIQLTSTSLPDVYPKYRVVNEGDGNIVYYWDKNGTTDKISLVSGKRVIVRDYPYDAYNDINQIYPNVDWCRMSMRGSAYTYGDYMVSTDSWSPANSKNGLLFINSEVYEVMKYHKIGTNGVVHDAKFSVYDNTNGTAHKYTFSHHDTYEYEGKTYTNVYIQKPELKDHDYNGADSVVSTQNGEITFLAPAGSYQKATYNDSVSFTDESFYIKEIDCDDGFYFMKDWYIGDYATKANYGSYTYDGNKINSASNLNVSANDFSYSKLQDTTTSVVEESNVINYACPYVKKVVSFGDQNQSFPFEIVNRSGNVLGTFSLRGNESIHISPKNFPNITLNDLQDGIFVRELTPTGWNLNGVSTKGASYYDTTLNGKTYYRINPPVQKVIDIDTELIFTNSQLLTNLVIVKYPSSSGIDTKYYSMNFDFDIEAQFDQQPLNGTFPAEFIKGSSREDVTVQFVNGHANVSIPATANLKINNLPAPLTYKVTEEDSYYTTLTSISAPNGTGNLAERSTGYQTANGKAYEPPTARVAFGNARKFTGKLRLHKIVTGEDDPEDESFTFNVKITMEDGVSQPYITPTVKVIAGPHEGDTYEWNGTWTNVSEADSESGKSYCYNMSTHTLYEGDTIEISGLPVGAKYKVTEEAATGWFVKETRNTTGFITEGGTTAEITNLRRPPEGNSLSVSKTVAGSAGNQNKDFGFTAEFTGLLPERTYFYEINGVEQGFESTAGGAAEVQFTLKHGETAVFKDLPTTAKAVVTEAESDHTASYVSVDSAMLVIPDWPIKSKLFGLRAPSMPLGSGVLNHRRREGGNPRPHEPLPTGELNLYTDAEVAFTNTKDKVELRLLKTSIDDSETPVPGAEFNLYTVEAYKNSGDFDSWTSTSTAYSGNFDNGQYIIKEVAAPEGYIVETAPLLITIRDGAIIENECGFIKNETEWKTQNVAPVLGAEGLSGAEFTFDSSDNTILFENVLSPSCLIVTKTIEGCDPSLCQDITFAVTTSDGKWVDKNGNVVDEETFIKLEDFEYDGDIFTLTFDNLDADTYTVEEVDGSISGYELRPESVTRGQVMINAGCDETIELSNVYRPNNVVPTGIDQTKKNLMIAFFACSIAFIVILRQIRKSKPTKEQ